jgi:hypothetical protein
MILPIVAGFVLGYVPIIKVVNVAGSRATPWTSWGTSSSRTCSGPGADM